MTEAQRVQPQGGTAGPSPSPKFRNILCAVDGEPGGFVAVEQAAALAGPGGHLTLLLVTSFESGGQQRSPAIGASQAKGALDRAKEIAEKAGVASTAEVDPAAPPSRIILEWSAKRDLLALGAPTTPRLRAMFIAGVADTALGSFTTPLLAARSTARDHEFGHHIVVASDGRDGSDQLVELARRLAQARGAEMMLVHAAGHESRARLERVEEQGRRLALTAAGTNEVRVERGHAHEVIVGAADSLGASMLVMGSRRLDGLRSLGSVSRRVVHEAPCSVLLVPPEHLQA